MEHLYRRRRDAFGESEVSEFVRPVVGVPEVKPAGPQWMMLPRPGESERERGRARVAPRTDTMTYCRDTNFGCMELRRSRRLRLLLSKLAREGKREIRPSAEAIHL